jgi:hypothetical protein
MDPASVIALVGSVVGVIEVVLKNLNTIRGLQQQWKDADQTVMHLITHLTTLKAALNLIAKWVVAKLAPQTQHQQLVVDLSMCLESCKILIMSMDTHVSRLEFNDAQSLSFQSRVRVVMEDKSVKDSINFLNNQTIALNLLLTALNWSAISDLLIWV